jgi:hypothetical protein
MTTESKIENQVNRATQQTMGLSAHHAGMMEMMEVIPATRHTAPNTSCARYLKKVK